MRFVVLSRVFRDQWYSHTADADLLAIRLKHSTERIAGEHLAPDEALVGQLELSEKHVALVVQVKTGKNGEPGDAFLPNRMERCIDFIGMADERSRRRAWWTNLNHAREAKLTV